jgi:imidazolonepropionase
MPVIRNIGQLATPTPTGRQGELRVVENAALVWHRERVTWIGRDVDLPARRGLDAVEGLEGSEEHDAGGRLVVPGLVDAHTHLAFAGWRADEFERRLRGERYQDIAASGGGILRTVDATRAASESDLVVRARGFLRGMAALGVTTVECKSGYGLSVEDELKQLRAYRTLAASQPIRIVPTLLGAHTVPREFRDHRAGWIDLVCETLIARVAADRLALFCDVFVDEGAFAIEEGRRVLEAGMRHGLRPKLHADQLRDGGGAALAADVGAVSADHLEHVSRAGIAALASAGTIAVTLPIAAACLDSPVAPARGLLEAGVGVAVATDFNPGSAPSYDLPLALWLACTRQRMTPDEALDGATRQAARALALHDRVGCLESGWSADVAVIDAESVRDWLYFYRPNVGVRAWVRGRPSADESVGRFDPGP